MLGRVIFAIVLVAVGVLWIADLQGSPLIPGGLAMWWPSLLIVWGVARYVVRPVWRKGPLVLITLGALLQADKLGYLPRAWLLYILPLLLIALGVSILLGARRHRRAHPHAPYRAQWGFRVGNVRPVHRAPDDPDVDLPPRGQP